MRDALERRLLDLHNSTRLPLDRLRKEAALQRLLARIAAVAPPGSWALKGGLAMIARAGDHARATADADATWRADQRHLRAMLDNASMMDLEDHFEFTIGQSRAIRGEGPEGGFRFPVVARPASRTFENLRIDVNIVPEDPRPTEKMTLRNLSASRLFLLLSCPQLRRNSNSPRNCMPAPATTAIRRTGGLRIFYDMLVIAQQLPLPARDELAGACRQTFDLRQTAWPPVLRPPPRSWDRPWRTFTADYGIQFTNLDSAYDALVRFWQPVFAGSVTTWNADRWAWS